MQEEKPCCCNNTTRSLVGSPDVSVANETKIFNICPRNVEEQVSNLVFLFLRDVRVKRADCV